MGVEGESKEKEEQKREQKESNKSLQDLNEAPPTCGGKEEANQGCRVAPPEKLGNRVAPPSQTDPATQTTSWEELPKGALGLPEKMRSPGSPAGLHAMEENWKSPLLTSKQRTLLSSLPGQCFLLPGGKRAAPDFQPSKLRRRGVLDLEWQNPSANVSKCGCSQWISLMVLSRICWTLKRRRS